MRRPRTPLEARLTRVISPSMETDNINTPRASSRADSLCIAIGKHTPICALTHRAITLPTALTPRLATQIDHLDRGLILG